MEQQHQPVLYAPADGEVVPLSECSDSLFASGKLGPGFVLLPSSGEIHAPVSGTIRLINANGHGFGITTDEGFELLMHLGTDTGDLAEENGRHPFNAYANVGEHVCAGKMIAGMKNSMIRAAGRSDEIIVLCNNVAPEQLMLDYTGPVQAGQSVAHLV